MGSIGAFCVCILILFVIIESISYIQETESKYNFNLYNSTDIDYSTEISQIYFFNKDFSNLAGVLCAGYFLHQCSLPIIRNSAEPEKNLRNVFLGYLIVFLCYCIVGSIGYIGFSAHYFK